MVWIRIIFIAFLAMYIMYYALMIGHLFNLWKVVNVKIEADGRSLIFCDVIVRVNPNYALAMHIDTDESNAASCTPGMEGDII